MPVNPTRGERQMDAETRDAIRDLCEGVAILAVRCAGLIGTNDAGEVCGKAKRLSERMDALDAADEGEGER